MEHLISRSRSRSRSPLEERLDFEDQEDNGGGYENEEEENGGYDDDQEDNNRYDKNQIDSKKNVYETTSSSGRERGSRTDKIKSGCKVYISNFPISYKWQEVKDFLRNKVGMVDFVETFVDKFKKPKVCAVVEFRTKELADLALVSLDDYEVDGCKLRVFDKDQAVTSREFKSTFRPNSDKKRNVLERINVKQAPNIFNNRPRHRDNFESLETTETYGLSVPFLKSLNICGPLTNRVFVANIDFKAKEEDLWKIFEMAGKVQKVELSKENDGKSRGFAVVEFDHPVHAVQAISMFHNQKYFDRELCVRMDRDGITPKRSQPSNLPPGLQGIGVGLGSNGLPITDVNAIGGMFSREHNQSLGTQGPNMPMASDFGNNSNCNPMAMNVMNAIGREFPANNSFGGGFQNSNPQGQMGMNQGGMYGQNMDMMRSVMDGNMGNAGGFGVGSSRIMDSNPGMGDFGHMDNRGCGMSEINRGMGTMGNTGRNFGGSRFDGRQGSDGGFNVSNLNSRQDRPSISGRFRFDGRQGQDGGFNMGNSNFRQDRQSSTGRVFNLPNVVHISNLPQDYTWQNLRDLCRDYGEVRFAEISGKGVGLVRFANESGASMAIDLLDRQMFDGRLLEACVKKNF